MDDYTTALGMFLSEPDLGPGVGIACLLRQTLESSFSAVSKPNFASKYSLESSRRDLHNALLCTALKSHFFQKNLSVCTSRKSRKNNAEN